MKRLPRYALAGPLFIMGWYFFFVSVHLLLNSEADMSRILIGGTMGLLGAFVGGYALAPVIAQQIKEEVMDAFTAVLDRRPGGRRATDPPPEN